jgi:hypothetical protein
MLEAVGHPRVVNPDRALRRIARDRHWPVLAFRACSEHVNGQNNRDHESVTQRASQAS